jgi:hypothetical protein
METVYVLCLLLEQVVGKKETIIEKKKNLVLPWSFHAEKEGTIEKTGHSNIPKLS